MGDDLYQRSLVISSTVHASARTRQFAAPLDAGPDNVQNLKHKLSGGGDPAHNLPGGLTGHYHSRHISLAGLSRMGYSRCHCCKGCHIAHTGY
ncbi:hypothetical protein NNRS527_01625 [Nitrosospira sp. NRS527]|nr:hypothetical protein NNRS527_01625 [Nitrosospira sp. NRS527]